MFVIRTVRTRGSLPWFFSTKGADEKRGTILRPVKWHPASSIPSKEKPSFELLL